MFQTHNSLLDQSDLVYWPNLSVWVFFKWKLHLWWWHSKTNMDYWVSGIGKTDCLVHSILLSANKKIYITPQPPQFPRGSGNIRDSGIIYCLRQCLWTLRHHISTVLSLQVDLIAAHRPPHTTHSMIHCLTLVMTLQYQCTKKSTSTKYL